MTFRQASTIVRSDDGFVMQVPDGWQQGRGAFGGLVLGALLRAMQESEDDDARVPRSLSGEIVGPVQPGRARIEVTPMRRGNSLSALDARLWQGDEILARASTVLARERDVPGAGIDVVLPDPLPDPKDCAVVPVQAPLGPVFAQHYEFRPVYGFPFSGADEARTGGWVREKDGPQVLDHAALVGLLDSFWPVSLVTADHFRPGATVSFTAEFFVDPATLDPDVPLHFCSRGIAESGGYFLEQRELWHGETPVAMNQQAFAMIK